jgi:hypothetical protein
MYFKLTATYEEDFGDRSYLVEEVNVIPDKHMHDPSYYFSEWDYHIGNIGYSRKRLIDQYILNRDLKLFISKL